MSIWTRIRDWGRRLVAGTKAVDASKVCACLWCPTCASRRSALYRGRYSTMRSSSVGSLRWGRSLSASGMPVAGQDHATLPGSARSIAVYHSRSGAPNLTCKSSDRRWRVVSAALRVRKTSAGGIDTTTTSANPSLPAAKASRVERSSCSNLGQGQHRFGPDFMSSATSAGRYRRARPRVDPLVRGSCCHRPELTSTQ